MSRTASKLKQMVSDMNDIVEQTFYLEQKVYEWGQKVAANKSRISKAMGKRNSLNIKVDENLSFDVTKRVESSLEFYPDQLTQKLDKDILKKVIKKTVIVKDQNGLVSFLKSYGVSPREFKRFIETTKEVDVEEIDRLVEIGEIQIEDLQGCYKVDFDEEIRVRKSKQ